MKRIKSSRAGHFAGLINTDVRNYMRDPLTKCAAQKQKDTVFNHFLKSAVTVTSQRSRRCSSVVGFGSHQGFGLHQEVFYPYSWNRWRVTLITYIHLLH